MHFHISHPLQPLWNIVAAPIQIQAVEQAIEHRLFPLLQQPACADAVAERLGLHPSATEVWLDLLWSLELLVRQIPNTPPSVPEYVASPLAARFFVEASPDNCAQAWLYRARFLSRFSTQWEVLLREGYESQGVASAAAPEGSWAKAAREQIGQEQRAITVPAVLRLLETLPCLPETGRLLDLGGGPGHVGIALAQHLSTWQGAICDQPETAEVAADNIRQAGLADRLEALGRDLNTDDIGHGYDLIWCSSVLHFLRDPQQAVRKMQDALNPGGLLLLAHAELSNDAELAARVMPFYGTVKVRGNMLPRPGEVSRMMETAGFSDIRTLGRIDFPMAPVWLHQGRKV
ncbi:class I SAM-dependent methyltransferase [Serratia marcescens]|uniref:class I SAM-dependent methyltransferase n=1 Tax=Serratia marcescens TaxID=615 RepID=UPI001F088C58|nr:class I SAM-dependent methyltransferase [Serratia marcescens]